MNAEYLNDFVADALDQSPLNYVSTEKALEPRLEGLKLFEDFEIGYADSRDDIWDTLASGDAGLSMLPPIEWLPEAKTVMSVFTRYSESVRKSNVGGDWPSLEWFHGRIDGQAFGDDLILKLKDYLLSNGYDTVVPLKDPKYKLSKSDTGYYADWSERHAAYAAGLGTFSLSKGLITEKGTSGRFSSLITTLEMQPTRRKYSGITDYCSMCGKCAKNCPVKAIDINTGKNDMLCGEFLDKTREFRKPYYGCGKCECGVPCETRAFIKS